jgi:hypothetical protein
MTLISTNVPKLYDKKAHLFKNLAEIEIKKTWHVKFEIKMYRQVTNINWWFISIYFGSCVILLVFS